MARTYVFRLTAEGVRELERDLKSLGNTGERAFDELSKRVPGLAGALSAANQHVDAHRGRLDSASASLGGLIARYTSWGIIIGTTTRALREAAETHEDVAKSLGNLGKQWTDFTTTAVLTLTPVVEMAAGLLQTLNGIGRSLNDIKTNAPPGGFYGQRPGNLATDPNAALQYFQNRLGGVGGPNIPLKIAPRPETFGPGFDPATGNYIPGTSGTGLLGGQGFPETSFVQGVTDLTALEKARADAAKKASDLRAREQKEILDGIQKETDWWNAFYANKRELADKSAAAAAASEKKLNEDVHDQILELSRQGMVVEKENAEARADIYKEEDRQAKERADRTARYWTDTLDAMTEDGRNFFERLFETGEGSLKDFIGIFKSAWARLLSDLVTQQFVAPLMRSVLGQLGPAVGQAAGGGAPGGLLSGGGGGMFGGLGAALGLGGLFGGGAGAAGYTGFYNTAEGLIPSGVAITPAQGLGGFSFSGALGSGLAGAGLGSVVGGLLGKGQGGQIGGIAGGALGGIAAGALSGTAMGAMLGTWAGPIGMAAGALIGTLAGNLLGGKPSNYRATATFGAGGEFALSGDKPNEQTLGLAQQAAAAISEQIKSLTAFGVQFTQQLSNIWIGQRDASTYQLAGGGRVSVGTVANVADLTGDTIAALLKSATSSDPEIAAILKSGGSAQAVAQAFQAMQATRAFSAEITQALLEIQDPMKAAIALWQKEAQARLDTAAALGVSIEKVQELNAALYQQLVTQQNAGVVSSIGGFLQQMQYGPASSAAPNTQYAAALADYEKARAAALSGGAPEAQAYLEMTQKFLPFAREYLGTTQAYETIRSGAETTLQGLMGKLSAPAAMPELVIPIVQATTNVGAATVEAIGEVKTETKALRESVDRLFGEFGALLRQVKPV